MVGSFLLICFYFSEAKVNAVARWTASASREYSNLSVMYLSKYLMLTDFIFCSHVGTTKYGSSSLNFFLFYDQQPTQAKKKKKKTWATTVNQAVGF